MLMSKQSESSSSSEATRKLWSQVNIPKKKKDPQLYILSTLAKTTTGICYSVLA